MDEYYVVPATRTDSSGIRRGWVVERKNKRGLRSSASPLYKTRDDALAEMKRLMALKGGDITFYKHTP